MTIRWQAHFDDSLTDRPLFLLANEFFDALPIRQYVKTERGWCERMVVGARTSAGISPWRRCRRPPPLIPAEPRRRAGWRRL